MTFNAAEQFVYDICTRSFLSLWSYANPQGRTANRELCDILVVCDPDVIIFSVKEVRVKIGDDSKVAFERWARRAVDESVAQIYGAEKWINSGNHSHVIRQDGQQGIAFPDRTVRQIHRFAVALGGDETFPLPVGDHGKGFVHVLDRRSFQIILNELDTITDFVNYLRAKEVLFASGQRVVVMGEENLLAVYLHNNRSFPDGADLMIVEGGGWEYFAQKPEVRARDREDEVSYVWDRLIELLAGDILGGHLESATSLTDGERVLRGMARESRFNRRMLGNSLQEFLDLARREKVQARMVPSPSGAGYVFLARPPDEDADYRSKQLALRCFVARKKLGCSVIIGLGTEQPGKVRGFSRSIVYLRMPDWTQENEQYALGIMEDLGYFASPDETHQHYDEYPRKSSYEEPGA